MFKEVLVAAAIALACPASVFAQDINFLFGGNVAEAGGNGPGSNVLTVTDPSVTSGSVNIFVAPDFGFDAADLNFFSSDTSVAQITGGEAFNPTVIPGQRFDVATLTVDVGGGSGNLIAIGVLNDNFPSPFDPLLDAVDGFLIARVDFDILAQGTTEFSFGLGDQGLFELPNITLNPTFGSATLEVNTVPEPSSAIWLILGSVAMIARRKRAQNLSR